MLGIIGSKGCQINREHSQVELLIPDRVEVAKDGLGPALGLAHLDSDVRVTGAGFILGLQPLRTHDWTRDTNGEQREETEVTSGPNAADLTTLRSLRSSRSTCKM